MGALVAGPAADWLASRREVLNERFERARRRSPALDPDDVSQWLTDVLPLVAGPEPGAARLCEAVFDLVLLHAGRGAFARCPGLGVLLTDTFPALRAALLAAPTSLPGALSNAVENLGPAGATFARRLPAVAELAGPDLLDAGAVLAWRLGEARLRVRALELAARLPPAVVAVALDLPVEAVPTAVARLTRDAWSEPVGEPAAGWRRVGAFGDFSGFGGDFDAPPRVLDGGDTHLFHLSSAGRHFRVDADRYGAVVRPEPDPGLASRLARAPGAIEQLFGAGDRAAPDGTFRLGGETVRLPVSDVDTWRYTGDVLILARRTSHRVQVWARR